MWRINIYVRMMIRYSDRNLKLDFDLIFKSYNIYNIIFVIAILLKNSHPILIANFEYFTCNHLTLKFVNKPTNNLISLFKWNTQVWD